MGEVQFYSASITPRSDAQFQPAFQKNFSRRAANAVHPRDLGAMLLRDRDGMRREFLVLNWSGNRYYAPMDGHDPRSWHIPADDLAQAMCGPVYSPRRAPSDAVASSFVSGTKIRCRNGDIPVENLQPGDLVATVDSGFEPLRWINRTTHVARGGYAPVKIRAGALGANGPKDDLFVAQQTQVLVCGPRAQALFGQDDVLVPAGELLESPGIALNTEIDIVSYHTLLFDKHEILTANGALCESFHPAMTSDTVLESGVAAAICKIFPELEKDWRAYGDQARFSVNDAPVRAWLGL